MWRVVGTLFAIAALGLIAFGCYRFGILSGRAEARQSVIGSAWSAGIRYPELSYGAIVWIEENPAGTIDVYARVLIGTPPGDVFMTHDVGLLATEPTSHAAIRNWSSVVWSSEAVTFGPGGPKPVILARLRIEAHR